MSQDPYLPRYKDQVASVAAERRPPNRDPDGVLLAREDAAGAVGESSDKAATRAETEKSPPPNNNNNDVRAPASSSGEATVLPIAFNVMTVEDNDSTMVSTTNPGNNSKNSRNQTDPPQPQTPNTATKHFPWNTAIVAVAVTVIAEMVVGGVCGTGSCGGTSAEAPTSTRSQDITNVINSKSYMGVELSPTGTSPEERALEWLINDDPLQLNAGAEAELVQRYSLLTLWFQGDTGTWRNSDWLTADECTWFGIACDELGTATSVALDQNGLEGSLSPDLGLLTGLTSVNFYGNNLSGSLPSQIGLWTNLMWFNATINSLTGSLPSEIGSWTNLTIFDLGNNTLTGSLPSEIGLWTNLELFYVYNNALTGAIPSTITNWKLIRFAGIQGNDFTGSIPGGICEFIDILEADCDELICSC